MGQAPESLLVRREWHNREGRRKGALEG